MIDKNGTIIIKGKKYNVQAFMEKFRISSEDQAVVYMNGMLKKGKATLPKNFQSEEELLETIDKDLELENIINKIEEEEESARTAKRNASIEDVDVLNIRIAFDSTLEAVQAEEYINKLGIEDTEISIKSGAISLIVSGITPQEYTKIANKYQLESAIKTGVNLVGTGAKNATDAVNYVATKVVAPVAKIAGEAGMNLGKGLVHTGVKVGSGIVNSGAKAVQETKVALSTDPEMLKAKKELVDAKDGLVSFFKKKMNKGSRRGIEVI